MTEFPLQLVVPIGAVLAAGITASVSFISLIASKEQKVSEFRQTWIDALRKELAEFASNARRISTEEHPVAFKAFGGSLMESIEARNEEILRPDPFHENRLRLAQAYYSIRLRLNPEEADHNAILRKMDEVYGTLAVTAEAMRYQETVEMLDKLSVEAQTVLKREWNVVKEGESKYQKVVTAAKGIGLVLAVILVVLIWFGVKKAI